MGVSENNGTLNRFFPYKSSILGYPYFWKHPYHYIITITIISSQSLSRVTVQRVERFDRLTGPLE